MTLEETIVCCNSSQSIISDMTQHLGIANDNEGRIAPTVEFETTLSNDEKKRKIEEVYTGGSWMDTDKYEEGKIKDVVRKLIFKKIKFCKGEGSVSSKLSNKVQLAAKKKKYGMTHEREDLRKDKGYVFEIMKECGITKDHMTLHARALWWKCYNHVSLSEIRQQRGKMNYYVRKCITTGM